jgi:hypothetical protein
MWSVLSFRLERGGAKQLGKALGPGVLAHGQLHLLGGDGGSLRGHSGPGAHHAQPEVPERSLAVEGDGFLVGRLGRVREGEDQRTGGQVAGAADLVQVLAVDVAVEDGDVLEWVEQLHHRVAIAGEPLPLRLEIEERPVGEDDDGGSPGEARQVLSQPGQAGRAHLGPRPRDVVDGDEVHPLVIEGVAGLPEELAEERAAVEAGVVLSGDHVALHDLEAPGDLLELAHARRRFAGGLAVVGEIAGEEDEVGPRGERVDHRHRPLEGGRAGGVGRSREADVGVGELHEGEGRDRLAVGQRLAAGEGARGSGGSQGGRHPVERPGAQRQPGDA